MDSLLTRLKPFYIAKLEEVRDTHPYAYATMISDLTNNVIYGDLKVSSAMTLASFLAYSSIDLYNLNSKLFKPLKIK